MSKKKKRIEPGTFQVGTEFKLFKSGAVCKVTAIENGKVKFESNSGMTGTFPLAKLNMHV